MNLGQDVSRRSGFSPALRHVRGSLFVSSLAELRSRGFENAGIYDPAGVGGTHVMYVLQHADQPTLYHGLPKDPKISPWVSVWKGVAKPLAVAAMVGAAVVSFFHYMKVGPIETDADEAEPRGDAERVRHD